MARNIVSTDDLLAVCVDQYGYSEPLGRVLSNVLFWSQFAEHHLGSQVGFFKTDAELARDLHKHPKTVGRLLRKVCAPAESGKSDAVFFMRYAPRPWDHSGRVRWLFRTELGAEIIDAAKARSEARLSRKNRKQNAAIGRIEMHRSTAPKRCGRSPQNAATHIKQKDFSNSQEQTLSLSDERETPEFYEEKESREGLKIEKFASLWKTACEEVSRPTLTWRPSEISRWSADLSVNSLRRWVSPSNRMKML